MKFTGRFAFIEPCKTRSKRIYYNRFVAKRTLCDGVRLNGSVIFYKSTELMIKKKKPVSLRVYFTKKPHARTWFSSGFVHDVVGLSEIPAESINHRLLRDGVQRQLPNDDFYALYVCRARCVGCLVVVEKKKKFKKTSRTVSIVSHVKFSSIFAMTLGRRRWGPGFATRPNLVLLPFPPPTALPRTSGGHYRCAKFSLTERFPHETQPLGRR